MPSDPGGKFPGFVVVPFNFDVNSLKTFINNNLKMIRTYRIIMRGQLYNFTYIVEQITEQLRLSKIVTTVPLSDALQTLTEIFTVINHLEGFNLDMITFKITGDNFDHIEMIDDTIAFSHQISPERLLAFLQQNQKQLFKRYVENTFTDEHRERVHRITQGLAQQIGVKKVIIGNKLIGNSSLQFLGVVNLSKRALDMKRLNMKNITIVIQDQFEIDVENRMLFVPYNFDLKQLQQFVVKLGQANKKKQKM
eukprot:TRINITY_DN6121_c0_g1_i1.p1 TRINITY_DN6121_c0_g1~~TRINITY_DN6121_c0_g1_i1.p1  ORF type:complete len:251 (+),score=38.53 TRINITY_DN6121_c0_g1_i1:970-1722(+)